MIFKQLWTWWVHNFQEPALLWWNNTFIRLLLQWKPSLVILHLHCPLHETSSKFRVDLYASLTSRCVLPEWLRSGWELGAELSPSALPGERGPCLTPRAVVLCLSRVQTFSTIWGCNLLTASQLRLLIWAITLKQKTGVNIQPGFVSFHLSSFEWLPV